MKVLDLSSKETSTIIEGKLTVKHWLRKDLPSKEFLIRGKKKYPIYIRVTFQRKQKDFPSQFEDLIMNVAPKRIPYFPIEQLVDKVPVEKMDREYFSEGEFADILSATSRDKAKYSRRQALQEECRRVYNVADLLRHHNINFADRNDSGFILNQLTHPISYALDYNLKHSLSNFIIKHKSFKDGIKVNNLIDWLNPFSLIYPAVIELANDSFRNACMSEYSKSAELYQDLEDFIELSGRGHLCFDWADNSLFALLNEYYDLKIKSISDASSSHFKVNILRSSLADYFKSFGELGSRLFK